MTERERYIEAATPEEWDRWLSYIADCYALLFYNGLYKCSYYERPQLKSCPFGITQGASSYSIFMALKLASNRMDNCNK